MQDLVNEFKNLYTELETEVKKEDSNIGHHKKNGLSIEESFLFTTEKERMFVETCKDMRNILFHHKPNFKGKAVDFFTPKEEIVEILKNLINKIKRPRLVKEIYLPLKKVYSRKLDDLIFPTMKEMSEKIYTHVPILNSQNSVIGVFSENTIFSYLLDEEIIEIPRDMKFKDLSKYLDTDKHLSEVFKFIKLSSEISKVKDIFGNELKENKRIGMIFITQNGKKEEPLLGILTPWDLAGEQAEN